MTHRTPAYGFGPRTVDPPHRDINGHRDEERRNGYPDLRKADTDPSPRPPSTRPTGTRPPSGSDPDPSTSVPAQPVPRRWLVLAIVGVAQLMVVLDSTIVNIALPSAQADLGFGNDSRQWVITAYSLAFGSLLLLGGRLSDMIGRRRTLLIGLIGFAAASAVGGASTGLAMLIAARALQGVFAAILAPAALSTLNVTFTDVKSRSKAFGVYAAIAASGAVVGLILGGALTEWLSWRWCLYVNLAFAIPAAIGAAVFVATKDSRDHNHRLDIPGVLAVSGGLFCLVYGLSNAETHGWDDRLTIIMLGASAALLVAFVVIETAVREPLLPLRILADRNRGGSYLAIAFAFCGMFAAFLFLTYYFQQNLGYTPLKAGVAFLPLAAGIAVSAGTANQLVPRLGPRPLIPLGMLIGAGGMFWLAQLSTDSTYTQGVLGPLFALGAGMGLTFAPAIATASTGVDHRDAGVASAMVNTSQQIGGAIGAAALSTVFASALTRYVANHGPPTPDLQTTAAIHGYTVAFTISCGLFLGGVVITALLLRSGRLPDETDDAWPETTSPPPEQTQPRIRQDNNVPEDVPAASPADPDPPTQPPNMTGRPTNGFAGHRPNAGAQQRRFRAAELLDRGINHDGVRRIIDLEFHSARIEVENRYLAEQLYLSRTSERIR